MVARQGWFWTQTIVKFELRATAVRLTEPWIWWSPTLAAKWPTQSIVSSAPVAQVWPVFR